MPGEVLVKKGKSKVRVLVIALLTTRPAALLNTAFSVAVTYPKPAAATTVCGYRHRMQWCLGTSDGGVAV